MYLDDSPFTQNNVILQINRHFPGNMKNVFLIYFVQGEYYLPLR